jgi:LysM repeat protein
MNKEHEHDTHLNAFWDPVQLSAISSEETRKVRFWGAILFTVAVLALLTALVFLIIPSGEHLNLRRGTSVVVDGKTKASRKIVHSDGVREELALTNIQVGAKEDLASKSPLLRPKKGSVVEYRVQSGDTIQAIAAKFYGSSAISETQKIRTASGLSSNTLRVGQRLIIPF